MVDTRARIHERRPRPPLGVAQWSLPRTMRFSRWPRLPLFLQRRCDLDAPQRATRSSPTPDLESRAPQSGQALRPFERHLSGGPEGHGKRVGRKSWAKANVHALASAVDPSRLAPRGPSSLALSSASCRLRCVRDGMEAHSRACTRPHRWPRPSFRLRSREGARLSEDRGAFHRQEPSDGRDRSLNHPTGPPRYAAVIPALQRRAPAPLLPKILAWGWRLQATVCLRLDRSIRNPKRPVAAPWRLLRLVRPRNW